ncbi:p21-activated protein kinase-interacting protein 1-like [Xenopus laevis]|uniref:P21-activated protein kinase-interacting protein 1-like n=2 Tax=Xenopus laevis TaxID=8355 RepID=A0A8J1L2A1_XENLA|nr:p21-activated protein kinase-interacting protein 1-like [Xenopus laevis]
MDVTSRLAKRHGIASMEESIELLVGCYEQVLFGYRVHREGEQWLSSADFTHHAHTASVSVLAVNNRFVATGSRDESIQIYDMKKKGEHGALLHHNGTAMLFFKKNDLNLVDGLRWNISQTVIQNDNFGTKHQGRVVHFDKIISIMLGQVVSLSIHPSGKLALSAGTDETLRRTHYPVVSHWREICGCDT